MRAKTVGTLGAMAAAIAAGQVHAAPFTAGDLAVYRVGTGGTQTLANTGNAVFIDEYTTAGAFVQSIAMPTTASGGNLALFSSGTATSEGMINNSADGRFLVLTGYAGTGSSSIANSAATSNARVVGLINASGAINTSTGLTDYADANNPRTATSIDGTQVYVAGGAGGVRYAAVGSTTSLQLGTNVTNVRDLNISNGNLYLTTNSGTNFRIAQLGSGLPTTSGQTAAELPGIAGNTGSQYQIFLTDLSPDVPGVDTMYAADDSANAILKYSLVAGTWVPTGSATASNARGLVGSVSGTSVALFATTGGSGASGGGSIYSITDNSGYDGILTGPATTIASAGSNTAFRGIAFAPTDTPEPGSLAALALVGLAVGARRRTKR